MAHKEDVRASSNALEDAEKKIEHAILMLPIGQHLFEATQLKQTLQVVREVRKRLRASE